MSKVGKSCVPLVVLVFDWMFTNTYLVVCYFTFFCIVSNCSWESEMLFVESEKFAREKCSWSKFWLAWISLASLQGEFLTGSNRFRRLYLLSFGSKNRFKNGRHEKICSLKFARVLEVRANEKSSLLKLRYWLVNRWLLV